MMDVAGISGNVNIKLTGLDGQIKMDITRKNIAGVTAYVSYTGYSSGTQTWGGTANVHFASSQTALTYNDNLTDSGGVWATLGASKWYYKARTGNGTVNSTASTPYCTMSYNIANGLGTGTIKALFLSDNNGGSYWHDARSPGYAIILAPEDWIVKGDLDTLDITWTVYLNGPFKTQNIF